MLKISWILCENIMSGMRVALPMLTTGISFDMEAIRREVVTQNISSINPNVANSWNTAEAIVYPGGLAGPGVHFPAKNIQATELWSEVIAYTSGKKD